MRFLALATIGLLGLAPAANAAETPRLIELRTQRVNGITYFHVRFDRMSDQWVPEYALTADDLHGLANVPRLVPQDDETRAVACLPENFNGWGRFRSFPPDSERGLEFLGIRTGTGRARFVLQYPRRAQATARSFEPVEVPVDLSFENARHLAEPAQRASRQPGPAADDLEGWWAVAQTRRYATLEAMTPSFGFYGFARAVVARQFHVDGEDIGERRVGRHVRQEYQRLYELTTGAAALTESLQLERMLGQRRTEGPRDIDLAKVPGIDIAEHDWKKMMGDKTPDPEPLAKLVPYDNYYLHFERFGKFVELGDFLEQWGTTASRAYEVQSTDHRLKKRYERQLCIKTSLLGRTLGPLAIKGLAFTGSDPYFREGTDVAVIFHVVNADLFKAGVEPYLREARAEFGDRLREGREQYDGVSIETYVTPRREVSLHRATFDEFVVYANSGTGIRRILDARAGRIKPLADSLDFRYMRTIFKLSDGGEDGFLFLSDPFIRQVVGPATKIKEKRRLEGLTGLTMATNAALWHAWQTGRPPATLDAALATAALTPADLATPDQPAVTWDATKQLAAGDRYNTLHFATPLVEIPIDRISREEEQDYNRFRLEYLGLWRQYFDPVGMRFRIRNGEVSVETFILPLVRSTQYAELRRTTGGGTVPIDTSPPTAKTVAQLLMHLSPEQRTEIEKDAGSVDGRRTPALGWLGDWCVFRFDDSPMYAKLAALSEGNGSEMRNHIDEAIETVFQMPITLGVQIRYPLVFAAVLTALRTSVLNVLPDAVTWEPMEPEYKGAKIVRIRATEQGANTIRNLGGARDEARKDPFLPAIYYALVDGVWYASLQEQPIKDMIDRAEAGKKQPGGAAADSRQVNSALYVSPAAATAAKDFARGYLATEIHQRALANAPIWYAFQKAGLLAGKEGEAARQAVLYRYLGYVPVSADGAAYVYDPRTDEMANTRHGSPRRPTPKPALDPDSPHARLLEMTHNIRADLRFREDGVHTTVTIRLQQ
jgi:hypothetical protein